MADRILILLLSMGIFLLVAQWLIFMSCFKRDKPANRLSREEEMHVRQLIYNYLYQHPHSTVRYKYPHLAEAAEATKTYEHLNYLYEQGEIDEIDYNLELEKILPKINIEQDF